MSNKLFPNPIEKISSRRYLALGAAWLEALKLDRETVLRRWPTTDRLVLQDPLDDDDLGDVSVVAARLVDLARASMETTAAGDGAVPAADELLWLERGRDSVLVGSRRHVRGATLFPVNWRIQHDHDDRATRCH